MIRPATYQDIPTLTDMVLEFFSNDELADTGLTPDRDTIEFFIEDLISSDMHVIIVAEADGLIVGSIAGGITPWMFNANITMLAELGWFIPKQYRKKYPVMAMKLRRALQGWGKDNGATVLAMSSTTREESPRVREFYAKTGLRHMDSNYIGKL